MDQSLHIELDDAPLAHRGLDGVLITSNRKEIRSPVAWYSTPLFGCKFPLTDIFFKLCHQSNGYSDVIDPW